MEERLGILIVGMPSADDTVLKNHLDESGFLARFSESYDEALPLLDPQDVILVIIRYGEDGEAATELLGQIRQHKTEEFLPVFISIPRDLVKKASQLIDHGADDCILEPLDMTLVMAKIRRRVRRQFRFEDLKRKEERYTLAAYGTNDGIWDWDLRSGRVFYSKLWKQLLGIAEETELTDPSAWFDRIHPDDLQATRSKLAVHIEGVTAHFEAQFRMRHADERYVWILCRGVCARDDHGQAYRVAGTLTDLTNRSQHDVRTGLPFRTFFMDRLQQALVKSQLSHEDLFAVLYVDIDRFKIISEGFGHNIVDQLLVAIARRIEACLGRGDTLAFLGGDSFVILLEDHPDMGQARMVANQIHMQLIAPFHIEGKEVFTKASIGITKIDHHTRNPEEILRQAQTAMKFARTLGSGHSEIFGKGMASKGRELLEIESKLRAALDQEEFLLYYQPQVRTDNQEIIGMETLLRWQLPGGEMVPPGKFIPIAEETDLILTIGEWVLRAACLQNAAWQRQGLPPLRVAVNLSERQFRARNLVRMVENALTESGLEPALLELEITESIFMENAADAMKILLAFKDMGIKIALDDFGTGYSSLSYLKKFPLDTLKIDRMFVMDLTHDAGDAAICSTIISLAHKFNMDVVAEGVETREQLIILRAFQCDEFQGHFFSKALPKEHFEKLLIQGSDVFVNKERNGIIL